MASTDSEQPDALFNLRRAIALDKLPLLTTSSDPNSASDAEQNIARATHLLFSHDNHRRSFSLNTPTRFVPAGTPLDLRSIYFAWLKRDVAVPEYIAATQRLNEELSAPGNAGGTVQNLVFVQKLDLIAWLQGASDESEYIKPLASETASKHASTTTEVASSAPGATTAVPSDSAGPKAPKVIDPRLVEIYNGERKMGDRNSILRGIKPTDFSHVRKYAASFLGHRSRPGAAPAVVPMPTANSPALVSNLKKPARQINPIILLSPSASSLLRMSNIKEFLGNGVYAPPDSSIAPVNLHHITRRLPSIDPSRPIRFILVDTPDQFKPDYWSRVVAVFTTGQKWQFKSYKWTDPAELFTHAMGIYVGWRGEDVPADVKGWGRGVMCLQVDKWNAKQGASGRWRDKEVVEQIWNKVEESMRSRGWSKDGLPGLR